MSDMLKNEDSACNFIKQDRALSSVQLDSLTDHEPRIRRLQGIRAIRTWNLKRNYYVEPLTQRQTHCLLTTVAAGRVEGNVIFYRGATYTLRPTVTLLLKVLWACPIEAVAIDKLCRSVYGRPASMRAIRQTVFRINRAFENVACPLFAHCHASTVYLRPRFRSFEHGTRLAT